MHGSSDDLTADVARCAPYVCSKSREDKSDRRRSKPAEDRADAREQPRLSETLMVHAELTHGQGAAAILTAGVDEWH